MPRHTITPSTFGLSWVVKSPFWPLSGNVEEINPVRKESRFSNGMNRGAAHVLREPITQDKRESSRVQLRKFGLTPEDIGYVLITHLHFDHVDDLLNYKNAKVYVGRKEWEGASAGRAKPCTGSNPPSAGTHLGSLPRYAGPLNVFVRGQPVGSGWCWSKTRPAEGRFNQTRLRRAAGHRIVLGRRAYTWVNSLSCQHGIRQGRAYGRYGVTLS